VNFINKLTGPPEANASKSVIGFFCGRDEKLGLAGLLIQIYHYRIHSPLIS